MGFSLFDILQGSPVARGIKALERAHRDPKGAVDQREERLKDLLDYACENVPYYHQHRGLSSLDEFPILKKPTVQGLPNSFLSSQFREKDLARKTTSGSYGIPLAYMLSREQIQTHTAELIFYSLWAGYEVGMKHLFITHRKDDRFSSLMQNQITLNPTRMDDAWLQTCVAVLKRKDIRFLIAQPSVLDTLRLFCAERGIDLGGALRGIIMVSEFCAPHSRVAFMEFFGCAVQGRYAAVEQGIIAQQCECGGYHVNARNHIVEILGVNDDFPVPLGTAGRIVITNLSAKAMPLIRYETGDLAMEGESCSCGRPGRVLVEVIGRQVEIITDTSGNKILPIAFWTILRPYAGILQYQFVQLGRREYELRLRVVPNYSYFDECAAALRKLLGSDAVIHVHEVQQLKALTSGKRPLVMNLYQQH